MQCQLQCSVKNRQVRSNRSELGLPGVQFLTGQSGLLAICPVKKTGPEPDNVTSGFRSPLVIYSGMCILPA